MAESRNRDSHRFVLVYYMENDDAHESAEIWRGWVAQVSPTDAERSGRAQPERLWFSRLDEIPDRIRDLMGRPDGKPG